MPILFDHERSWALYKKSTGGTWLSYWYRGDLDTFETQGVTYTRIGPVVSAREEAEAHKKIMAALAAAQPE